MTQIVVAITLLIALLILLSLWQHAVNKRWRWIRWFSLSTTIPLLIVSVILGQAVPDLLPGLMGISLFDGITLLIWPVTGQKQVHNLNQALLATWLGDKSMTLNYPVHVSAVVVFIEFGIGLLVGPFLLDPNSFWSNFAFYLWFALIIALIMAAINLIGNIRWRASKPC